MGRRPPPVQVQVHLRRPRHLVQEADAARPQRRRGARRTRAHLHLQGHAHRVLRTDHRHTVRVPVPPPRHPRTLRLLPDGQRVHRLAHRVRPLHPPLPRAVEQSPGTARRGRQRHHARQPPVRGRRRVHPAAHRGVAPGPRRAGHLRRRRQSGHRLAVQALLHGQEPALRALQETYGRRPVAQVGEDEAEPQHREGDATAAQEGRVAHLDRARGWPRQASARRHHHPRQLGPGRGRDDAQARNQEGRREDALLPPRDGHLRHHAPARDQGEVHRRGARGELHRRRSLPRRGDRRRPGDGRVGEGPRRGR
mmetsp:Transcript_2915/g.11931  ORF Transcript_2915/g.11931 Transcript_2915/m.11931 type:complete len:309 (-) Transcript_2915:300-1226(-)